MRLWQPSPRGRVVAAALIAVGLAAGTAQAGEPRTLTIEAKEFAFEPSTIQAEAGERLRIKLVNMGQLSHNLHFKGQGIQKGTATVQKNGTATVEITVPEQGPIQFFCDVPGHKQAGMQGELRVE